MKAVFASLILFLFIFTGLAEAEQITISSGGTNSEQNQINDALKAVHDLGGGEVYLTAGTYTISDGIYIGSNTVLTGDRDAIIRVPDGSNQWFIDPVGLINPLEYPLKNVEIYGLQIDGNLDKLDEKFADSGSGKHNAERGIKLQGTKKARMENIFIHDMEIYDTFSDGIHIAYADNVRVYNNFISNCQHSGVFLICVNNAVTYQNNIAGICSDCIRHDNCINFIIHSNFLYSYTGDNTNGQGTNGENGIQVADGGFSHGGGSDKSGYMHTANGEIYNNTLANTGWHGIWLDSTGKGYENVYIHDNIFLNGKEFTNSGSKVLGISFEDVKFDYTSSREFGKKVFSSIYELLRTDYAFQYPNVVTDLEASGRVTYYNQTIEPYSLVKVEGEDLKVIKYEYKGKSCRYFIEKDLWVGELHNVGNDLYIPGEFDNTSLKITVYSDSGFQRVENIRVDDVKLVSASINPDLFIFLAVLGVLGISISRNLRRIF